MKTNPRKREKKEHGGGWVLVHRAAMLTLNYVLLEQFSCETDRPLANFSFIVFSLQAVLVSVLQRKRTNRMYREREREMHSNELACMIMEPEKI